MTDANATRVWVFRGLVLVGTGLLLYSWFLPWWGMDIAMIGPDRVIVHPWGEEANLGSWAIVFDIPQMPPFFEPFAWSYLGVCLLLILASLLVSERTIGRNRFEISLPRALLGVAGIAYIAVPAIAALAIMINLNQFEVKGVTVPLQGTVRLDFGAPWASDVTSSLRSGYWLAWAAGLSLLLLALFRRRIIGFAPIKSSANSRPA